MAFTQWRTSIRLAATIEPEHLTGFAELTGDDAAHHLSADVGRAMGYEAQLAQGLLLLSLTGMASSEYLRQTGYTGVTYGYDRVRFPAAVYAGDRLEIVYEPTEFAEKDIVIAQITCVNDDAQTVLVATHRLKLFS